MDKAIKCLEKFGKVSSASIKLSSEIEEAIAELQAHKANIKSLKEYAFNKANSYNPKDSEIIEIIKCHPEDKTFYDYHFEAYADILQKLEELDKWLEKR